tara:strand:+ start:3511 stop:4155 length:645 start_codon:yes stop_codon:yes gene_type:complete
MGILFLPYLILDNIHIRKPINFWIIGIFKILKVSCNITYEIKGRENIPDNPIIIAPKHQSAFETFVIFLHFNNSIFIHKKELLYIPIFGQYLKKTKMISINRNESIASMRSILDKTKNKIKNGYSIIIFPEGTRKKPGEKTSYKNGIYGIYKNTNTDVLPIAVNSGKYWPKHTFKKYPGKITISILKKIPTNLNKLEFLNRLQSEIENEVEKIS